MKFWLLENNCVDFRAKVKEVDFPEITPEMFEKDNHCSILKEWLRKEDMDTLSSTYYFDEDREIYDTTIPLDELDDRIDDLEELEQYNLSLKQSLADAVSLLSQTVEFVRDTEVGRKINIYLGIK